MVARLARSLVSSSRRDMPDTRQPPGATAATPPSLYRRLRRALSGRGYPLLRVACEVIDHQGHRAVAFEDLHGRVRADLTRTIVERSGGRVQTGPFEGLTLLTPSFWGDGDIAAFLLGQYELELHPAFERAIAAKPDIVANIGCAGGLYAVGLSRRLPDARVHAVDIDTSAGPFVMELAAANAVAERVAFEGACDPSRLQAMIAGRRAFLLVDCEGYEVELIDPGRVPALAAAEMIIETHRIDDRSTLDPLVARLAATHEIEIVSQAGRNPHAVPLLRGFSNIEQWLVLNENRAYTQHWLVCWPRA
jgi:hypothetical protein